LVVSYLDVMNISELKNEKNKFDTVICLNVIEHMDDDEQAMKNIVTLLNHSGQAIVLVPRGQRLFGTLDEILGHKKRYSKKMLQTISKNSGLKIVKIIPFHKVSTIPWFINGRILHKRTFGLYQIFIMNLLTPIFRKIDRFLSFPSLSYIAILEKTEF